MNNDRIVAVVVTYNRLELLKRVIDSLFKQVHKVEKIIIVNNGSTDGTTDYLSSFNDNELFLVVNQENVGGSGGFYRGIQEAMKLDCDWIWCMDDDVFPRKDCLDNLLGNIANARNNNVGILCPHRIQSGKTFVSESKRVNVTNPFKNTFDYPLTVNDIESNDYVEIEGMAFEGPLIKRDVVEKIGFPNKDFFILYDDTEYSYRTVLAGYKVRVVRDAFMDKYDFQSTSSYREDKVKNKWKLNYHIRNSAYFGYNYGKNIFVRYGAALPFVLRMYFAITFNFIKGHKYSFSDYALFWRMMNNGINGKLGKI